MAAKPIVIIHGWSDDSGSFEKLARRLTAETGRPTQKIWLGDYVSLDDDVRLADITAALHRAWHESGLGVAANSVDVIVHSTGGLVIREWMHAYFTAAATRPPVQNLVMLAPANFGSPLAHKGRSLIGRVIKGAGSDKPFQTGTHILKVLEMASPATWELAERDRFTPTNAFNRGGVRCTVIVGNAGYPGIKGLANEDGSDGTVYVATANLNCARIAVEVSAAPGGAISIRPQQSSRGKTAFLVLDGIDHAEITGRERLPRKLLQPILTGLSVKAGQFGAWCQECEQATAQVEAKYANVGRADRHAFQNTVFRVADDQQRWVDDYAVEFYGRFDDVKDRWARVFNKDISAKTHPYGSNPAYRSFMINVTRLEKELARNARELCISLSALPDVTHERTLVGYRTTGLDDIGALRLDDTRARAFFQPSRTLLVDIRLPRFQEDEVFSLARFGE